MTCASCKHSIGTISSLLMCNLLYRLVARDEHCKGYEREPGADDE